MNISIMTLCMTTICGLPTLYAATHEAPATNERVLKILVYDYSGSSDSTIKEIESVTALLLSHADIRTQWLHCRGHLEGPRPELCTGDLTVGAVLIRVLPAHVGKMGKVGDPLGSAIVDVGYASVYATEARKLAAIWGLTPGALMGYAMAHEIGHLLLGEKHAASGLMRAVWSKDEYKDMAQLWLGFSQKERQGLRDVLSAQSLPADLVDAETPASGSDSRIIERQMPAIRVWVMDSVRLDEKTLSAALEKAQVIFEDAGVRVIWLRCSAEANQAAEPNPCQADDTNKLFLRIVRQPASGFGSQHALGQAFSGEVGSQYATVFHDRVLAMVASRKPGSEALVLGHAIAHELGHLMLGTSAHASFGLMAAGWSAAELERAPAGLLEFSSAEAAIIRAEALRRFQQPSVSQKP